MKNLIKRSISLLLSIITVFIITYEANATQILEQRQEPYVESVGLNSVDTRVTGLIYAYEFYANKDGTNLIVCAELTCATSVVKCGIKEMVIQRRVSTDYDWSDYLTYEDLYQESSSYLLGKSIAVTTGYQYRVVATLYAKKSLFSTEKIEVTSNIVWI